MSVIDPFSTVTGNSSSTRLPRTKTKNGLTSFLSAVKKITFRKVLLKLHLYISLWLGAFLVLAGLTGSLLVYDHALDKWLNSELMVIEPVGEQSRSFADLIAVANQASPIKTAPAHLQMPSSADEALIVRYQVPAEDGHKGHNHHFHEVMVNQYTGQVIGDRDRFDSLMSTILKLHFNLLSGDTGKLIMGITALLTVVLTITGIYLWWPKLSKIKQAFVIKRNASFTRFNFDLHKTVGIYTALVMFAVSLSGVYFNLPQIFRPTVNYFSPLEGMAPPVKSETNNGVAISPEMVINIAQLAMPNLQVQRVFFPSNSEAAYQISGRQSDELRSKGSTMIWIDQYSGKVLKTRDPHQFNAGNAFINLQLPLHNGEILGQTGRVLVLIVGFAPLLLMITGVIHWLKKRNSNRVHKARLKAQSL
jgi:uncharacterized iron-regulated membrane protein